MSDAAFIAWICYRDHYNHYLLWKLRLHFYVHFWIDLFRNEYSAMFILEKTKCICDHTALWISFERYRILFWYFDVFSVEVNAFHMVIIKVSLRYNLRLFNRTIFDVFRIGAQIWNLSMYRNKNFRCNRIVENYAKSSVGRKRCNIHWKGLKIRHFVEKWCELMSYFFHVSHR